MRQTAAAFKSTLIFLMLACCLFFGGSCGLEEVIVVDEPTVTYNKPLYYDNDSAYFYIDFLTNEPSEKSQPYFIGTDVYYKIYNNSTTLVSERSSITSVNTSSNTGAAATRMIDSYSYQQLGSSPLSSDSIFVPNKDKEDNGEGKNKRVYIRLVDNGIGDDLKASIVIYEGASRNSDKILNIKKNAIPFRYSNDKSFDFFDNDDSDSSDKVDVEPVDGDLDYKRSSTATDSEKYFIQFFAVGVAFDPNSLTRSYSPVLDLGSIPIIKD